MKNKIFVLALASLLGTVSCNDYLDVNQNPDRIAVTELTPEFIFPGAVTNTYYVQARRLTQFAGLEMNSIAGNSYSYGTPFVDEYSPNVTTAFYADVWDQTYRNMSNFQLIINFNDANGKYAATKAISKVMKAYYMQNITDLWGDAPYSEAFNSAILTPKYDKGEDIYKASIADLESAVQTLTTTTNTLANYDVVFNGDKAKWIAFANTLKLRYLVRMSNVTGELATYRDQKLATLATASFIANDVTVNPGYNSSADTKQNPFFNYNVYTSSGSRPQNYTLVIPSEHIAIALNGNAVNDTRDVYQKFNGIVDGRRGRMFTLVTPLTTSPASAPKAVEGVRQGATPGQPGAASGRNTSRLGEGLTIGAQTILATDGPGIKAETIQKGSAKSGVLMTKAEAEFLLAEAAVRYPAAFSNAQGHFNTAVTASYASLGATGAAAYLTQIAAVPKLGITVGTTSNMIEAIMTQKWIALTGINPEQSYFDYTRTGFPITPLPTIAIKTVKPNRLVYPNSEYQSNVLNVPKMTGEDVFTKNQFTPFWAR